MRASSPRPHPALLEKKEPTVSGSEGSYTVNDASKVACGNVPAANATVRSSTRRRCPSDLLNQGAAQDPVGPGVPPTGRRGPRCGRRCDGPLEAVALR
ncbi:hypothetical protein [Streptomyces sp. KL2]|uniref:hypothetical protein n=1 Tax=Streptomyces sp. KL2 TaxID=3050126 RepID=UPI0039787787